MYLCFDVLKPFPGLVNLSPLFFLRLDGFPTGLDIFLDAELTSGLAASSVNSLLSLTKPPGHSLPYEASIGSGSFSSSGLKGESTCLGDNDVEFSVIISSINHSVVFDEHQS